VWFRVNVGRRQNADPRWLLPMLCRRGHVTKSEVGAIRIAANETAFQIPRAVADRFVKSVHRTASAEDDGLMFAAMEGGPREAARDNRRAGPGPRPHGAQHRRHA
jgi:ATP-dependent RNA helicase DeaD